jgi:hypothetical protein
LDESCGVYVLPNVENDTEWEQANQVQFGKRNKQKFEINKFLV